MPKTDSSKVDESYPLGIVRDKPKSGRFVATPRGFMVPYKVKIPGTKVTFEMVPIPDGKFKIGSPKGEKGRNPDEGPNLSIEMEPFWMGKTEVTWAEYESFTSLHLLFLKLHQYEIREIPADDDPEVITLPSVLYDPQFVRGKGLARDSPANSMTQFAARQYTKWISKTTKNFYRLPTEAEWEYACRAGSKSRFSFGDSEKDIDQYAWTVSNSKELRHSVAKKKPNAWGLYDMHGNVCEWVLDRYSENGFEPLQNLKPRTNNNSFRLITREKTGLVKGGSSISSHEDCRVASRLAEKENWADEDPNFPLSPFWYTSDDALFVGFRIMRPFQEPDSDKKKRKYWNVVSEEDKKEVLLKLNQSGRGKNITVDKELPEQVKRLEEILDKIKKRKNRDR